MSANQELACPTFADWIAFYENAPAADAPRWRTHLDACAPCRSAAKAAERVVAASRAVRAARPSAEALDAAAAIPELVSPEEKPELAEAVADRSELLAGVRGPGVAAGSRILYESDGVSVDLQVTPHEDGRTMDLLGQLLLDTEAPRDFELQLRDARGARHLLRPDELGEFALNGLPCGPFQLVGRGGGKSFFIFGKKP